MPKNEEETKRVEKNDIEPKKLHVFIVHDSAYHIPFPIRIHLQAADTIDDSFHFVSTRNDFLNNDYIHTGMISREGIIKTMNIKLLTVNEEPAPRNWDELGQLLQDNKGDHDWVVYKKKV